MRSSACESSEREGKFNRKGSATAKIGAIVEPPGCLSQLVRVARTRLAQTTVSYVLRVLPHLGR